MHFKELDYTIYKQRNYIEIITMKKLEFSIDVFLHLHVWPVQASGVTIIASYFVLDTNKDKDNYSLKVDNLIIWGNSLWPKDVHIFV